MAEPVQFKRELATSANLPQTLRNGMKADVEKFIDASASAWLTKFQVMYLLQHWQELDAIIGGWIGARTLAENVAHFDQAGVTIGPIMDTAMLERDRYAIEREALIEVPDDEMPRYAGPLGAGLRRCRAWRAAPAAASQGVK